MSAFPESMRVLIEEFTKMPGVGFKSAQRMAFYILSAPRDEAIAMAEAIKKVKDSVKFCRICNNLSDEELCTICKSSARDSSVLCVAEEPSDIFTIERSGTFSGVYHILLGSLSPLDGVGPGDLKIEGLINRVKTGSFKEIIIATSFNTEGETTALYLMRVLKPYGVKLTRVAYGIPVGGNLQYADQATIIKAFDGRREIIT